MACPLALVFAFPKANATWLAFIGLAPLFWLWSRSSWKTALWSGFFSGAILYGALLHWVTDALAWQIGGWHHLALALGMALEGLYTATAALIISLVGRGRDSFSALAIFAAPSAWLLLDQLRQRGTFAMPFGDLGLVAAHLPWLLPAAAYVGLTGVGALVALVNGAAVGVAAGAPRARLVAVGVIGAIALFVAAADVSRARVVLPPASTPVAIAQGDISQKVKWSPEVFARSLDVYTNFTRQAAASGAKIVVWPETAITAMPLREPLLLRTLERLAVENRASIVTGAIDAAGPKTYYNAAVDFTPEGGVGGIYAKHILVPLAEYLPLAQLLSGLPLMDKVSAFEPGPGPTLLDAAGMRFGMLICFESAFAGYTRATTLAGADALIIITDDDWFGRSAGPLQHADFAVFDAVQTGRWVVRGADTGVSEIIDPKGRILQSLPTGRAGVIAASIGSPVPTAYVRFGSNWLYALALIAVVIGLVRRRPPETGWRSKRRTHR